MIYFLAVQVRLGRIVFEDIPEKYREEVEFALQANQYYRAMEKYLPASLNFD